MLENTHLKFEVLFCETSILKNVKCFSYKTVMELVSHLDQRINTKLYQAFRKNLVPFFRDFLKFSEYSEMEILNIAGILDTNCFEIILPSSKIRARGIYPITAMMSHECIPNTKHFVDENLKMKVIACSLIRKGEMILTSYTHPLKTTVERRYQLKEAKCFDCLCSRCEDPTEMKTFASGLKCVECKSGVVLSTDPLNSLAEWKCLECIRKISAKQALTALNNARMKLETINKRSVEECENYLKEFEMILAPSSVFMIDVKYALSLLYGNVTGFMMEGEFEGRKNSSFER